MSKSVKSTGSSGAQAPLEPVDFLSQYGAVPDPFAGAPKETLKQVAFNPDDYEYIQNPSSLDKGDASALQAARQPITDVIGRSLKQFGANVAGAIATSALNTADVGSTFDVLANKETDFNSKVFGVSTADIMAWSNNVNNNNPIFEKKPGSFSPGSLSWWGNQVASAGTGVGMGIYALGETAAITAATEGLGTVPEIFNSIKKIPQIAKLLRGARTVEEATEIANTVSRLKRTATTYAILNRFNESKMEAQQTFEEAYRELKDVKNPDGTNKYSDEEARSAAASGARRDFLWNMPLMALDVLTYRTMVFNPFAGTGTGVIEKGLEKAATSLATKGIAGKAVGWALPHVVGMVSEGLEEGLQFIGSEEGKHYARTMVGLDDGKDFFNRVGKDVTSAEFWNNFAGGVIGSPIIGGTMKLFNMAQNGRAQRRLAQMHKDFISNIGVMDDHISNTIREYEAAGNIETANVLRRNFGAMKAMSALYLDGMKGSTAAFDSYKNFLTQVLDEVNQGKFDSLQDLGFENVTQEQVDQIKKNFQTYIADADRVERLFNAAANQHEKQFVPEIAMQMFSVETRREKQSELLNTIDSLKSNVFGYSSLTNQGKDLHDYDYQLIAHEQEIKRLNKLHAETANPMQQKNIEIVIGNVRDNMKAINDRISEISADESYTKQQRDADAAIINSPIRDNQYYQTIRDSVANSSQIQIESRDLALWNDEAYKSEQAIHSIINSRTKDQLNALEADLDAKGKLTPGIKEAIEKKRKKLAAAEAVSQQQGKENDVETPVATGSEQQANTSQTAPASPTLTTEVQAQNTAEANQAQSTNTETVIPQNDVESAKPTTPTLGDSNLFGEEMAEINNLVQETEKNEEAEVQEMLKQGLSETNIVNIDDIISNDGGRLVVQMRDQPASFKGFDVLINPDDKTAQITNIQRLGNDAAEIQALVTAIRLGQILAQKGITLQNNNVDNEKIEGVWNNMIELRHAFRTKNGFEFSADPIPAEIAFTGPVEESLSPVEINDNLSQDQKDRLKNAVSNLLQNTTHPTFEDLVRAAIKQSNTDTADKTFNLLARGWELNGYPKVDYRQVYQRVFADPIDTLNSLLGELANKNEVTEEQKPEVVQEATVAAIEDTIDNQNKPNDFDNNGQPIYNYTGKITEEVQKKFAFLSVPYETVMTVEEDGTVTLEKKTIEGEINKSNDVDSLKLLDPNKYTEGTQMEVMIPSNYLDIMVSTTNPDGTPGPSMTFGKYLAEKGINPNDINSSPAEMTDEQRRKAIEDLAKDNYILTHVTKGHAAEAIFNSSLLLGQNDLAGTTLLQGAVGTNQQLDQLVKGAELHKGGDGIFISAIPKKLVNDYLGRTEKVRLTDIEEFLMIHYPEMAEGKLPSQFNYGYVNNQQFVTKNSTQQEFLDKVPMIIYEKGNTSGKGVAFVHDTGWYNPINFNQTKPGEMEQAIKVTREMRKAVLDAKGKPVSITITSKRETTFEGLKLPQGTQISLQQANPQTVITVATNINQLTQDGKNIVFDGQLANVKPFSENMAYDVRQTGTKDGKPLYTAFPVTQPALSDSSKMSITMALKAFVNAKNPHLVAGDKAVFDNIHAQILATSGIDIRSNAGIQQYLSQFMYVANLENAGSVAEAEAQLKGRGKKEGYKYITINSSGGIVFGTLGKPMTPKNNGFFVNPNPGKDTAKSFQLANSFLDNLSKTNFLNTYQQHVHFQSMNKNKPVVQINTKGEVTTSPSYKDFLMNNLMTNVRSLNIGTQDKPNYVTNVQPIITYELTSKLSKDARQETIEEVKEEVLPNRTEESRDMGTTTESQQSISNERERQESARRTQQELVNQAREELGLDFLTNLDEEDLAPVELNEEQRESIEASVQGISGLNPQQQSELIDFMYNQVVAQIDIDNKEGVSKEQVYAEVKKNFEAIIKPLRKAYSEKAKQIQDAINADPESPYIKELKLALASYNNGIKRINDIQANYKLMEEETALKVSKYTNIHKGKLKENEEQDDDSETDSEVPFDEGDGSEERSKEFGTDSLSENPDNKLTYAMRRFLGQIRRIDKDGNPATGFLKLPVYVGSDTVASTVRDLLADVPSDFNVMMDKLEKSTPAHPWLRQLIDRLKASNKERQNQFVTVMSNHRLSMKFSMISYDNKSKTWSSKVFNTFQSGLAAQLALSWNMNFIESDLVTVVNGVYTLDVIKAQELINEYDSWLGTSIPQIKIEDLKEILPGVSTITSKKPTLLINTEKFTIKGMEGLKDGQKARFKYRNIDYQVQEIEGFYQISFLNKTNTVQTDNVRGWLERVGIKMSDAGFTELMTNGLYHNFERIKGDALYTNPNGLFRILATAIRTGIASPNKDLVTGEGNPLNQSVIKSLANLESNFNTSVNSPNGRDNGKSIFGFTAPKFITDRTRDLKTKDGKVVQELSTISFSKKSLWLDLLMNSEKFRDQFEVSHIGLTAMKEMGKKVYKDNGITKLSDVDHELTKLIMFWDSRQGEVSYNNQINTASDTTIGMRMATMFVPTMSDKSNMMLLKTAVMNLEDKHFQVDTDGNISLGKEGLKVLFEQTVRPELLRMVRHAQLGGKTNISSYDKGAKMFLLIPEMNYIKFNDDLLLIDAIENGVQEFNLEYIESRPELMNQVYQVLDSTMKTLVKDKLDKWNEAGFITLAENGQISKFEYLDKKYGDKFAGTPQQKAYKAAIDFELNYMVATANSFMLYAGDPAMYYKSKNADYIEQAKDTFVNVGKRLANQIAPGTTIANSENEKYIQLFIQDRTSLPEIPFLKFATRVNDGEAISDKEIDTLRTGAKAEKEKVAKKYPKSAGYFNIEGADAQEYTTWKEHLSLLEKLGKTGDGLFEITPEEIQEARELFASWDKGKRAKLTAKQEKLVGKVMQPMKPVYTGQIYDPVQDTMRVVYIKSSSFPLVPQLTAGLEIDKLREKMEDIQTKEKKYVRASYQTANKVGSVNNAKSIWNNDGNIDQATLDQLHEASLVLDRKNFRIQQDVPFKSGKRLEDKITLGTQLMKVLFGNGVIDADGFTLDGQSYTGKQLHEMYNTAFDSLIKSKKQQLHDELGLDDYGVPIDESKSISKLQQILKAEAVNRGYPIQDIEGLNLDSNGNFITPLWSSANSNRYEAMLNAIVSNRLIKIKFPGNSYVVGSEEGFKFQEDLTGIDQSKIIWTSKWNGKGLQGSFKKDGSIEKAQVLVASKFRDNEGNLIDLFTKKDGEYVYVTKSENGSWMLKENMIDPQLMSLTSFRIPTSGHVSAAQVEIAGIIPAQSADLMIVPRNFTKQMGLDFDIDKQYTYQLWHYQLENGKFVELTEEIKNQLINDAKGKLKDGTAVGNFMAAIFGDELPAFTEEEIKGDAQLRALSFKLEEKVLQNKIIKIHSSVLTNPSDKIQSKINGILSTDYAEEQAEMIDSMTDKSSQVKIFTPLSTEYQKMKMGLGAAGKIGTGAYSLDVTFHSLVQQAKSLGKTLYLTEPEYDDEGNMELVDKQFRFGTQVSDGKLGGEKTIDGDRSIAEVLAELQNVALDNEKLQVMGRVGLNDLTIDVSKVFALLGFDKGTDQGKSSVQFTFLSQPIIKDFVKMMKNASSNMAEFSQDKEQLVITQLLKKYNPNNTGTWEQLATDPDYKEQMARRMSTAEMLTALKSMNPDGALQEAILYRFLEMRNYGVQIRSVQTGLNADAKGLGKSFFDVIARREALNKIGGNNVFLQGAKNLIGEYVKFDALDTIPSPDHVYIGDFWVKPTSLTGSFNVYSVTTAYNLWSKHLPYDTPLMTKVYGEIMTQISSGGEVGLIDNKGVILKQEIFKSFKKFLSANPENGIVNNTDDINSERARLYLDTDTNTSLAKYIKSLRETTGNRVIDNYIKTNKLINRFEFDINKNGQPSLIKFNNAVGEEFDEQYLYNSIGYLLAANKPLPDLNGKPYTTTRLAQDLVAYTYLGNAIQEAIQFTKYTPVTYTNMIGYGDFMRKVASRLNGDLTVVGAKMNNNVVDSDFTLQFLQHNPERVRNKIPASELSGMIHTPNKDYRSNDLNTLQSFSLITEEGSIPPKYISIYNKGLGKKEKKFQLYMNQGDGVFKRIPVLGTFGMDEYDPTKTINNSLVNGKVSATVMPSNNKVTPIKEALVDKFNVNSGNAKTVLENIAKAGIQGLSDLAAALAPFSSDLNIRFADIVSDGNANENNISIRQNLPEKGDYHLAMTILHEVTHGLTVRQIKPYIKNQGNDYQVVDGAPAYVSKLVQLYNVAKSTIGEEAINALRGKIALQRQLNGELQAAATEEEKAAIRERMNDVALTPEEKRIQYGAFNLHEFMAMALTQPEFQKEMAKYEFKNSGQSLLTKFKEILNSILRAIGVDYSEKSVTAQAINSIFELITDQNKIADSLDTNHFDEIAEQAFTDFEDLVDREFRDFLDMNRYEGDVSGEQDNIEDSLSVAELPSVQNVNKNNCF